MIRGLCPSCKLSSEIRNTSLSYHYKNLPMQYRENFLSIKNGKFQWKNLVNSNMFDQNIDCGYMLEPPLEGGSNEYPKSMFWIENTKNRFTPVNPSFTI